MAEDSWANAKNNARPDCPKCKGTGKWKYDENHSTICDLCCKHNFGFHMLKEHYGQHNGHWCCLAGCGYVVPSSDITGSLCPTCKVNTMGGFKFCQSKKGVYCQCCGECWEKCS